MLEFSANLVYCSQNEQKKKGDQMAGLEKMCGLNSAEALTT